MIADRPRATKRGHLAALGETITDEKWFLHTHNFNNSLIQLLVYSAFRLIT